MAVRKGLVKTLDNAAILLNFVKYNETVRLNNNETNAVLLENGCPTALEVQNSLTVAEKKKLLKRFTDAVCMVAYVFRARGHHYMDTYEEVYDRLWKNMKYTRDELIMSFK